MAVLRTVRHGEGGSYFLGFGVPFGRFSDVRDRSRVITTIIIAYKSYVRTESSSVRKMWVFPKRKVSVRRVRNRTSVTVTVIGLVVRFRFCSGYGYSRKARSRIWR